MITDPKVITADSNGAVRIVALSDPQRGGVSHFAGPTDQSTINGHMALTGEPGREPWDHYYAAMRWDYCRWENYLHRGEWWSRPVNGTSNLARKNSYKGLKLLVTHVKSGKQVVLRAADTGPRPIKRVIDVSPHVELEVFGGRTDDEVIVELAPSGANLGPYTKPSGGGNVSTEDIARDIQIQLRGPDGHGWPQLGHLSVVDGLAAIGENLGIPGFKPPRPPSETKPGA